MKKVLKTVFKLPMIFVKENGKTRLVASMVFTTITTCVLSHMFPEFMPIWMHSATRTWV